MANILLHKDGVFNVYCTISDRPWFDTGVKENDLKMALFLEYGKNGLLDYQRLWSYLLENGTTSRFSQSLKSVISANRAGPKEKKLSYDEFVNKFLTISENYEGIDFNESIGEHFEAAMKDNEQWLR